jgi:hypothetical protein
LRKNNGKINSSSNNDEDNNDNRGGGGGELQCLRLDELGELSTVEEYVQRQVFLMGKALLFLTRRLSSSAATRCTGLA